GAGGEFGRQHRMQIVLEAMAKKIASPSSITHFNSLMNEIKNNVKTDLTLGDLNTISSNYKDANVTINKHQLSGQVGIQ
ncbi:LytR family transcriptional regulator, partial [Staphylococcus aureus]|nr:LytR family transcriptional regulator [Staphylococcus aureus]